MIRRHAGLWIVWAIVAAAVCANAGEPEETTAPCCHSDPLTPESTTAIPGESLYALDVQLVDQHGTTVGLDVYRGHPVIITMFFGQCQDVCPMQIARLKTALGTLNESDRKRFRVLLISLDPARDTPAALAELARKLDVDRPDCLFATTSVDRVREVAAALGIRYVRLPDGSFNHSAVVTLLDESGVIQRRAEGLTAPLAPLLERPAAP